MSSTTRDDWALPWEREPRPPIDVLLTGFSREKGSATLGTNPTVRKACRKSRLAIAYHEGPDLALAVKTVGPWLVVLVADEPSPIDGQVERGFFEFIPVIRTTPKALRDTLAIADDWVVSQIPF